MKPFQSPDLFNLDSQFSSEEILIRDTIRQFVTSEIMPSISNDFENGVFPKRLIPLLAELGTFGATIKGYGCAGVNYTSYGLIMQELERGDSGLRSFVSVQGALCMYPIAAFGTEEQKLKYLPKMAKGEMIGCFGLTEPDFGSNPGGMITRVKKEGNFYILNGSKMWITNGGIADLAIVWAKNESGKVIGLIVDRESPGFTVRNIEKKFSLKASITSELIFEDCKVPVSNQLQVEGLKGPFACLNHARYGISWGVVGASMACYDEAINYSQSRIQFDKPIAGFQLVQAKLVEMYTDITLAQALCLNLGRNKDKFENLKQAMLCHETAADKELLKAENQKISMQISMAKMNNVSKALKHARMTRDILGASGITLEYQCGRHMMNLESVNTYEGTEDIHRLILGEYITGVPAFR